MPPETKNAEARYPAALKVRSQQERQSNSEIRLPLQEGKWLALIERGLLVFPCRKADKRPFNAHGFKDASIDGDVVATWWKRWPDALVGVPTGGSSGLYVIDIDSARHDEANDWLERHAPFLPETRQHQTKSGGWHLLFQHRNGLRNSASR